MGQGMTKKAERGNALSVLVKVGVLVAVVAVGVTAFALSRGGDKPTRPVAASAAASTSVLQDYAERLTAYSTAPGYGDVSIDNATDTVTVYWKGAPPAAVTQVVSDAPAGIHVVVRPSAFSTAELTDAQNRVLEQAQPAVRQRVADVEAAADRSGLVVNLTGTDTVSVKDLENVAGVPVNVQYGASKPVTGPLSQ